MVITLCAVSKCGERPNVKCESAMQCDESVHCALQCGENVHCSVVWCGVLHSSVVRGKMCWRFIRGGCWED